MGARDDPDYPGAPATVASARAEGVGLRPARWGLGDVVVMLALAIVLPVAGVALLHLLGASFAVTVITGGLLSWLGLAGWPIIATVHRGNGPRIDLGLRLTWADARSGLWWGIGTLILAGLIALALDRLTGGFTSAAGTAAARLLADGNRLAIIVFALMVMVGAPIVEEIAFRGLAFGALRKRGLGTRWSVVGSAVLFALLHLEPTRLILLVAIGIALGAVRARTGSTGASIVAHMVVNAPGGLFLLFGVPGMTP